ncbi:hypothetical protein BCR32DRAFT_324133 [Anaeromyces robustus]|uniref:Cyclin N-terminal domain-containing protein n=1 Tax=Anaeromyces robustus TaxID=1754192 RepID=A0A1Y1XQU3_9FUNG|nr:hypothetical protein BCR32DRAFT_324133 [Anaeromyces robustus]|eukprot:ORX88122.1 hypothetical protein BCR32DRAFT_324133 [Anaeromyces robustus]
MYKKMNYQTINNNNIYAIPQQQMTPTSDNIISTSNNNKRLHCSSSDSIYKRRRVSPVTVNTIKGTNYPIYIQKQTQPIMITNYYKPQVQGQTQTKTQTQTQTQNKIIICKPQVQQQQQQHQPSKQQKQQSKQKSKNQTIDISNQFKVTQASEIFQGCDELSLPKLVIYFIYKIWCCCNLSQYQNVETSTINNGYVSPKPSTIDTTSNLYSTPVNYSRISSPVSPSPRSEYDFYLGDGPNDKINVLYKNIRQSKVFQTQSSLSDNHNEKQECIISIDSDEENKENNKKEVKVDPKDFETQILKASSRSCKGQLKNNYSKLIDYVDHLLKITQISFSSVILALEYIYRLKEVSQTPEGKFLNQWSYEEIIPVAFMMANKFISDDRYSNTVWANVTNISLNHLNQLEMKGLVAISFRLYISESNYNNWLQLIKKVSRELSDKYKEVEQQQHQQQHPKLPQQIPTPIKTKVSPITYHLSPNPFTPTHSIKSSPSSLSNVNTPSSSLTTAIYSPMTPSKIQQVKKVPNIYMAQPSTKSHIINMIQPIPQPQGTAKPQQLLPNLPMTRIYKAPQTTIITIPATQRINIPIPAPISYQRNNTSMMTTQTQTNVFFSKLNLNTTTPVKPQIQPTIIGIYPTKKTNIYPSPPLSRNTSPAPRYYIQNKNVIPQYIKNYQTNSRIIENPFIKSFQ